MNVNELKENPPKAKEKLNFLVFFYVAHSHFVHFTLNVDVIFRYSALNVIGAYT